MKESETNRHEERQKTKDKRDRETERHKAKRLEQYVLKICLFFN